MSVDSTPKTPLALMAKCRAALRRLLRLPPKLTPPPLLLPALLAQVPRARTVHQVLQLRALAASWLAAPQRAQLDNRLQQHLVTLASPQPSPKSTSSRTKTAPRTGKHRR
jgi:hypothetical protein